MKNIIKILKLSKPFHWILALLSVLIVAIALLQIGTSIISKYIVDEIERQIRTGNGNVNRAILLFILSLSIGFIGTVLDSLSQRLGDYTSGRIGKFLTELFSKKIFTLSQSYFDLQISGKIVHQLNRGILNLENFLGALSNFIFPAIIQSLFIFLVLAYYNITIALLAFLVFPIYVGISHISTKKWGEFQKKRNVIDDRMYGRIQEILANTKLVKSYNSENTEYQLIHSQLTKNLAIYDKQSVWYHLLNFARNFGLEVVLTVITIIVFYQTFQQVITFGTLVLILQLLNQLRRPLFAASFILERMQQAEAGSKEFFEILELPSSERFEQTKKMTVVKQPTIRFDDVTFHYKDGSTVLSHISCTLNKKETIAVVGHSGAGKTTLINLMLKFYDPVKGSIYLGDNNYKNLTHQEVRSHFGLVFQENELFSTTVFENVAYGMPGATEEDVMVALKKANAIEFVMKFPKNIHEEIGERGVKLSGGQKQRIQIARAILKDPPILVLDEATSSLDAKSEKLVQEALQNLMKNRLVIIIAHRFSTIQNADRIMVIDEGKIVDSGSPQSLAKKPGVYSELLRYQIEGNQKLLEKYELA